MKMLAGDRKLMEFGLRRAQGPNGAMTASKYAYIGGFDSTSNVLAGFEYGIPIAGTVAHSFITSHYSWDQLKTTTILSKDGTNTIDLKEQAEKVISDFNFKTNQTELMAFIAQAQTYFNNFNALVDTYSTLDSGVPNFLAVAYGLHLAGYKAVGIRLDSGDLVQLSKMTRNLYRKFAERYNLDYAANFSITASNDINEENLIEFNKKKSEITTFGIGTHLVTCQKQPALGGVYKLVEINSKPRVKLSNEAIKSTLPGRKDLFRLYDESGKEIGDLLTIQDEVVNPSDHFEVFKVFPSNEQLQIKFHQALSLYQVVWDNSFAAVDDIQTVRTRVLSNLKNFNQDIVRIPHESQYPIYISSSLHSVLLKLVQEESK